MTIHEFIETDKQLFYAIQCSEKVIDNPEADIETKAVALSVRTENLRKREELSRIWYWQWLLSRYKS